MATDITKALDGYRGALQLQFAKLGGHFGASRQAETGCADLIQRDPTQDARQSNRTADFVVHPRHARFIGSHVGTGDVFGQVTNGFREGSNQTLLVAGFRIGQDSGLAAAVGQASRRVLHRHGAS